MKVAALAAGYAGIEMGLALAGVDVELAWYAEIDPYASQILAHHYPDVPNHGDITTLLERKAGEPMEPSIDIITAGFPCQPVSQAGLKNGVTDERWIIDDVCRVASASGARWLILENVRGIFTANGGLALSRVCQAMAYNGFSRWEWGTFRASDIGAPHRRERWFCVAAADADEPRRRWAGDAESGDGGTQDVAGGSTQPRGRSGAPTDAGGLGWETGAGPGTNEQGGLRRGGSDDHSGTAPAHANSQSARGDGGATSSIQTGSVSGDGSQDGVGTGGGSSADADGDGSARIATDDGQESRLDIERRDDLDGRRLDNGRFGPYTLAVRRWEQIIGRYAPSPITDHGRLSAHFVEWMQGLPEGWVTDPAIGLSRSRQLKALGNGVVPLQSALAIHALTERLDMS